ncbi:TPA: hypothetical protein ACF1RY_002914 [Enterococcus hirae]|uniref:Uncharacterized protein n=2 Tax=Enterococcus hirae TaxID=1354 RepID=A0AB37IJY4_ENTHR|nr:hypothetical protein [Enterococcus hirae]RBT51305.1 hypothetical protein EA74_01660 [Enterococcus hirae]RBT66982.1 hypothetical protein EA82_02329 [Enterococcus hirae]RBT70968.1 hypothetical protein EB03_00001 [Enterococcus hirae]
MTNKGRFYKNVGNSILGKPFTRQRVTENERRMLDFYGNILSYHALSKTDSLLRSKFIDKNEQSREIINYLDKSNSVPIDIIAQSSTIKLIYQNRILSMQDSLPNIPQKTEYEDCLHLLENLYDLYNWEQEETGGRSPLVRSRESLTYYAFLMNSWVNSYPLNVIIRQTIDYYHSNSKEIFSYDRLPIRFDKYNKSHINYLVNKIISDIEHSLRFKIKMYAKNYTDLLMLKYSVNEQTVHLPNWEDFLEYGTTDLTIIELQNLGFPRHIATFLKNNYLKYFIVENGTITDFYETDLLESLRDSPYQQEFREIQSILGKFISSEK